MAPGTLSPAFASDIRTPQIPYTRNERTERPTRFYKTSCGDTSTYEIKSQPDDEQSDFSPDTSQSPLSGSSGLNSPAMQKKQPASLSTEEDNHFERRSLTDETTTKGVFQGAPALAIRKSALWQRRNTKQKSGKQ